MNAPTLQWHERLYHRDELRAGRYAALADAEGFHAICFALEALGLRLNGRKATLGDYKAALSDLAQSSGVLSQLAQTHPERFSRFDPLFAFVKSARNDAMHTGVYARHATAAAIELCIGLEEALMKEQQTPRQTVQDFMIKTAVTLEPWQPVAHARQLMLTHSFSFLPVFMGTWKLLSETGLARYMRSNKDWAGLLSQSIEDASPNLNLIDARVVLLEDEVAHLLAEDDKETRLWLVVDNHKRLCGVLSPFELI
jgi:CBS domain-containing protein